MIEHGSAPADSVPRQDDEGAVEDHWKREVEDFFRDALRELRELQQEQLVERAELADPTISRPAEVHGQGVAPRAAESGEEDESPHRAEQGRRPTEQEKAAAESGQGPTESPADRLEQLKRRLAEQLHATHGSRTESSEESE